MTQLDKEYALRCRTRCTEAEARRFLAMMEVFQELEREQAEEDRVAHAREMSKPRYP